MPDKLTHRRVLTIALPIVLSNATVPILGAVDTGVIGQLGEAAPIGAVGIGAIILSGLYWIFGFLRMGTTGLAAQAIGRDNAVEVRALLLRALLFAGGAGAVIILLQSLLFSAAFMLAPASDEVESLAREYLSIRVWSAPAAIAVYGLTGWLIAQERTRAVLVLQVAMNGLNILLDFVFVLGMGLSVGGVAAATVIAEWSGVLLGLWFAREVFTPKGWADPAVLFARDKLGQMWRVNGDILIRSVLLQGIFISFLFLASDFGDVTLAANQVLLQFLYITSYGLDGFAFAAETLVGQALGQQNRQRLRRAALLSAFWAGLTGLMLAIGFAVLGGWIVDIMTTADAVRAAARDYLPWMIAAPLVGFAAWILDGIFIGATRTRDMRNMMLVSTVIYAISAAALVPSLGNTGLWAALMISFVARACTLAWRYRALEDSVAAS